MFEEFFEQVHVLSQAKALDLIFETVDELALDSEFYKVDHLLRETKVEDFDLRIIIGFLTAILTWAPMLKEREPFIQRVVDHWGSEWLGGLV